MSLDDRLQKLCEVAKAINPRARISLHGIPDREDWWHCSVSVGDAILIESAAGPLDHVLDEALRKAKTISQRIRAVVGDTVPPPPK